MKKITHIIYCLVLFLSACSLISTYNKNIVINNSNIDNLLIADTNRYIIPEGDFLNYFPHDTLIIDYSDSILDDWEGDLLEEEIRYV